MLCVSCGNWYLNESDAAEYNLQAAGPSSDTSVPPVPAVQPVTAPAVPSVDVSALPPVVRTPARSSPAPAASPKQQALHGARPVSPLRTSPVSATSAVQAAENALSSALVSFESDLKAATSFTARAEIVRAIREAVDTLAVIASNELEGIVDKRVQQIQQRLAMSASNALLHRLGPRLRHRLPAEGCF